MTKSSDWERKTAPIGQKRRIGLLSLSVIPDDPRVRRQGDLLAGAGWEVVAIGLPGHRSPAPSWRCLQLDQSAAGEVDDDDAKYRRRVSGLRLALHQAVSPLDVSPLQAWTKVVNRAAVLATRDPAAALWLIKVIFRRVWRGLIWNLIGPILQIVQRYTSSFLKISRSAISPKYAERIYWGLNSNFQRIYRTARCERVNLWLANDWTSLPIARKLAIEQGVPFAYDTHELAIDEYAERRVWRSTQRPLIAAIEGLGVKDAAFVSCVSQGISQRLEGFYRLKRRPLVVRNTPFYEPADFRATGEKIHVLYHGIVAPGRGLEFCIESVPLWRSEFDLTIRGPGSADYLTYLQHLTRKQDAVDRITFAEAVPMVDLVRTASEYDVGLFALPSHSLQNIYVLPNKFFEYMMAGLALCVSDLPEMARILKAHHLGELIATVTPAAIATSVNRLNRLTIDTYKRNALAAAQEYNWQVEGRLLLTACERAASAADRFSQSGPD